jgi:hypothetical protein
MISTALALPNLEHLGAASRAGSLSRRLAVLHFDGSRILHFSLGAAFHTIRLHPVSPFLFVLAKQASTKSLSCQDGRSTIFENRLYICRFRDTSDSRLTTPDVALCTIQLLNKLFLYDAVDIAVRNGLSSPQPYRTVQENYPRGLATVDHLLGSLSVEEVLA